jgi:L-ascorbate metabolism protein UlaG (beta-lactamase superfamily)
VDNHKINFYSNDSLNNLGFSKISFSIATSGPAVNLLFPINGTFGNLNSSEAVALLEIIKPRIAIPSHFWTFIEQKGNPLDFLKKFKKKKLNHTKVLFMAPGESISL